MSTPASWQARATSTLPGTPRRGDTLLRLGCPLARMGSAAVTALPCPDRAASCGCAWALRADLRAWSKAVLQQFEDRVLPFTGVTALLCANLHVPDPRSFRSSMIEAMVIEYGFTLVTPIVGDFAGAGVQPVDPFADVPAGLVSALPR